MSNGWIAVFFFAWGALEVVTFPRFWKTPLGVRPFRVPSYWWASDEAWFGLQRSRSVAAPWLIAGALFLATDSLIFGYVCLATLFLQAVLFVSSQPRLLVAPAIRDSPTLTARFARTLRRHS
jgi:hypothetical protein